MQEFGINYPNGRDITSDILFMKCGVSGIPTTFFITKNGKVAQRWIRGIGEKRLAAFVEEILQ